MHFVQRTRAGVAVDRRRRAGATNENTRCGRRCSGCLFRELRFREEDRTWLLQTARAGEEDRPERNWKSLGADGLACHERDVATVDAEVVQFASGKAAKFVASCTVAAPFVEGACDFHCLTLLVFFLVGLNRFVVNGR